MYRKLFTILAAGFEVTVLKVYVISERCSVRIAADTSAILTGLFIVLLSPFWLLQRTLPSETLPTLRHQ
jgi:hypothetical protein